MLPISALWWLIPAVRGTASLSRKSARISPCKKGENCKMDLERAKYWISKGAQPSETVASFLKKLGKAAAPGLNLMAHASLSGVCRQRVGAIIRKPSRSRRWSRTP